MVKRTPNAPLISKEEERRIEARVRLGGRSRRVECPNCHLAYLVGRGHRGSAYCEAAAAEAAAFADGYRRVITPADVHAMTRAGVEPKAVRSGMVHNAPPGAASPPYRGVYGVYEETWAPQWAVSIVRRAATDKQCLLLRRAAKLVAQGQELPRTARGAVDIAALR